MYDEAKELKLKKVIHQGSPLGPDQADQIKDDDVSAEVFDKHNSTFNRLISNGVDIIVGGRGSGKTALLRCYRLAQKLRDIDIDNVPLENDASDYDIIIEISSEVAFYGMQLYVLGDNIIHKPVEMVVTEWRHLIGDILLEELIKQKPHHADWPELKSIAAYLDTPQAKLRMEAAQWVWGKKSIAKGAVVPKNQDEALDLAEQYLGKVGSRAVIIIDSLDEYQVGHRITDRTIGALLRFIRTFNSERNLLRVKIALPYEIFPEIEQASANPLRDVVKVDRILWTSTELMQMAAHRYKLFLSLHDKQWHHKFKEFDLSKRGVVSRFWRTVFPNQIRNHEGILEDVVTFLLRHTQLLPRQFILMLNYIIKESYNRTGGHRVLLNELVIDATNQTDIAKEVYSAYGTLFPEARTLCRRILGNFTPIFTYEKLEEQWKRVGKPLDHKSNRTITDFSEIVEMMLRMGIVGVIGSRTGRYVEAQFSYVKQEPLNSGLGGQLCVHPVFNRNLGCDCKVDSVTVLPAGVLDRTGSTS